MGWSTSLPVIPLSGKSIWISQKISRQFEEKVFSDWTDNIQSISVLQHFGNQKRKSSEKVSLLMCDHCEYSSESKLDIFEHFIKSHVFLCTLCSYAGLRRSCVLKHCLQCHEKVVNDKLKSITAYSVDVNRLVTELGASSKEFDGGLYDLQENKPLFYESDYTSDDDISKSSFLVKSHKETSDMESDIESKPLRKATTSSHFGERNSDDFVHFLDQTSSSGHKRPQHFENEYNELSDSNQMEFFFSSDGNENDPDLSESIFHDHKEMFMVSRLPFPIRQDDSPNEPMLNELNLSSDQPSILQTILQKDKLDPIAINGPSPTNTSSEKNCEIADMPRSISPSLSLPSGETLQKQVEAVISISSDYSSVDTQMIDTGKNKAIQPLTIEEKPVLSKSFVGMDYNLPVNENKKEDIPLSIASHSGGNVDNFLLSPISDGDKIDKQITDENSMFQGDVTDNDEKFTLLRNLLKDKHGNTEAHDNENKLGVQSAIDEKSMNTSLKLKSLTLRNASDMSLLQLLSTDIPFPLLGSKSGAMNKSLGDEYNSSSHLSTFPDFKCDLCKLDFINQSDFDDHVKLCYNDEKQQFSPVQMKSSSPKLSNCSQSKPPSSTSHHLKSSLVADKRTASKMLSKFAECHMKATVNDRRFHANVNSNNPVKSKRRFHNEAISRLGLKYRRPKILNAFAVKTQPKHKKRQGQDNNSSSAVVRQNKRKAEQDDDYYPESESSESSECLSADSFKQRKRSKRNRKHLFSLMRKPKTKMCAPVKTPTSCGLPAESPIENGDSSRLSPSLSSSLFQDLASDIGSEVKILPETKCSLQSIEVAESNLQLSSKKNVKREVGEEFQHAHMSKCQTQTNDQSESSLSQRDRLKDSPNLLHHLLTDVPIRTGTNNSNRSDTKQGKTTNLPVEDTVHDTRVVKTVCNKRPSNRFSERIRNLETLPEVKIEVDDSQIYQAQQQSRRNSSILNSILGGHSKYGNCALIKNRSHSATESDHTNNARYSEDIINHSSSSSRLSASMMDIPDPPAPTSNNEFLQQSSSFSTHFSLSSSSSTSQSSGMLNLNKPHKQDCSKSTLGNSNSRVLQSHAASMSSPAPPILQLSSSSLNFESEVLEDSSIPDVQRIDESPSSSSLLRNLLIQQSNDMANTK